MEHTQEECANCRFSRRRGNENLLACHFHPPRLEWRYQPRSSAWPLVEEGDWCGGYEPMSDEYELISDGEITDAYDEI